VSGAGRTDNFYDQRPWKTVFLHVIYLLNQTPTDTMNAPFKHLSRFLCACALVLALLVAGAPVAHAQIIFAVDLSDEGKEAVTDPDQMAPERTERRRIDRKRTERSRISPERVDPERVDARKLLGLLAEEGRAVYKGKRPVRARQIVFILGREGEVRQRIEGESFVLEPGVHPLGRHFPSDIFLALFEKAFPDSTFDIERLFPDSIFDSEERFPDSLFDGMRLKDGQVGIVLALAPVDEELCEEAPCSLTGMGLSLSPAR
jgi:hypothetical protein